MNKIKQQIQQLKMSVLLLTSLFFSNAVLAIDIAQSPLFIDKSATPNVMFVLDDSGSMDFDILTVPHWKAQNYDHDVMRYWARGGWLGWDETPTTKVNDATWTSYTGYCHDRNADGICYNELYLNDDNDRNDSEKTLIPADTSVPDWALVLQHFYFWEFPYGKCNMPSPPPPPPPAAGAGDWLPSAEKVFAFLTGAKNVDAHTGDFGPSSSPYQWQGANDPSNLNTDVAYRQETWTYKGELNTWTANNSYKQNATAKTACEGVGGTYARDTSNSKRVLHHAPHAHKPTWINGWSGAPTVDPLTQVITANGPLNSRTGDYHNEYFKNYSTATSGRARFDINGDGVGNDGNFREKDNQTNRVINYRYIQHLTDNTYPRSDWRACGETSTTKFYTAANACPRLNDHMPGNYSVASPNNPIDNPSNKVASSIYDIGKLDFVQLSSPAVVPRYIRSTDWVGTPRSANVDVLMPPWAANTKHAMSKHDSFPLVVDWRVRSSSFNAMYYRPKSTYSIWPDITEVLPAGCSNKFNCARSNPQTGTSGYAITEDLSRPRTEYGAVGVAPAVVQAGFVYEVWVDDAGHLPSRSKPEWIRGDSLCGSTGGYTITAADVAASFGGAGVVDPATGSAYGAGQHICFSYLNYNPDGSAGDGEIDLWDSHYRVEVRDTGIVVQKVRRTPHLKGEALYSATGPGGTAPVYTVGSHHYSASPASYAAMKVAMSDTRVLSTTTYAPANYATYSTDALCLKLIGEDPNNPGHCRTLAQVQENAANWYQYSRKRSFVAKGAIANLIAEIPDVNYGLMGTKKHNSNNISQLFRDIYDGNGSGNGDADRTDHNDNIRSSLYSYVWPATGTPLRLALERAGEYFAGRGPVIGPGINDHSTSPITESCQKNYAILLTDGYWNSTINPLGVANEDADPYGASYNGTLADVAKKYYDEDLDTGLANEVPTDGFDTNSQQHLTTIGIGFGVSGSLADKPSGSIIPEDGWPGDPDASGASVLTESSTWGGDPKPNDAAHQQFKIDDLWHAAYNSRGKYYQADNPEQLILQLKNAILTALAASGSASALSANSVVLTSSTRIYQTLFTSGEWTGEVKSLSLTAAGIFNPVPEWTAQAQLDAMAPGIRKIFTLDASGAGTAFRWADLSAPSQQLMLRTRYSPNVVENVAFGQAQLNYIRGQSDAQFRTRAHKLGDIIHSEPSYVGKPRRLYPDSWHTPTYSNFRSAHSARSPMVYVGANDGMLHAFDAGTGAEKYAYIPRVLLPDLNSLAHKPSTGQDFAHRYYVDDAPVAGDVFYSGAWHTVLVGGLRGGGKGIYALDVTTVPSTVASEDTIAGDKGLWEFTSADDIDMGYSFSKPSIVRLNNGNWAAIFGNGYNSTNSKAVMYIVEFNTTNNFGTVHKFDTGVGGAGISNGMSTPTVIDTNGDMIADRIYAGDLRGNVWSIDISDTNPVQWDFSYGTVSPGVAKPLFTATGDLGGLQPITVPIAVSQHPFGQLAGYILNFGTGRYIGTSDNTDSGQVTQTMYGLWDYGVAGITRADLLIQQVLADVVHATSGTSVRVTSADGPVDWLGAGVNVGDAGWQGHVNEKGWRMDLTDSSANPLDNHGERVVSAMVVRGTSIILSTLLPAADPCDGGGSGWTLNLNAATGSRFNQSPFDVDGDGVFSTDDNADWTDSNGVAQTTTVSGVKSDSGIPSTPLILSVPGGSGLALSDRSSGDLPTTGTDTFGSSVCVNHGAGACTVIPGVNPGDPATCVTSGGGGAYCTISGQCKGGSCPVNGFSDIGRQSWIQLE